MTANAISSYKIKKNYLLEVLSSVFLSLFLKAVFTKLQDIKTWKDYEFENEILFNLNALSVFKNFSSPTKA